MPSNSVNYFKKQLNGALNEVLIDGTGTYLYAGGQYTDHAVLMAFVLTTGATQWSKTNFLAGSTFTHITYITVGADSYVFGCYEGETLGDSPLGIAMVPTNAAGFPWAEYAHSDTINTYVRCKAITSYSLDSVYIILQQMDTYQIKFA